MDLNDLRVFVAVCQEQGVSAAARSLGMPKSSVSRALSRLETELGLELVRRTTRRLSITSVGLTLHARLLPLMLSLDNAVSSLPEVDKMPAGRLRVTVPVDFTSMAIGELLVRFSDRYPQITLEVLSSNSYVDMVAEGVDVAIRVAHGRLKDSSLVAKGVGWVSLQLFASPHYLAQQPVLKAPSDLAGRAWVGHQANKVVSLCSPSGSFKFKPTPRLVADDMGFVRSALRAGAGIGLLADFFAESCVRRGELVRVLPEWRVPSGRIWLVSPGSRNVPPKVRVFSEFMSDALSTRFPKQ